MWPLVRVVRGVRGVRVGDASLSRIVTVVLALVSWYSRSSALLKSKFVQSMKKFSLDSSSVSSLIVTGAHFDVSPKLNTRVPRDRR